jgi:hypothetical protein
VYDKDWSIPSIASNSGSITANCRLPTASPMPRFVILRHDSPRGVHFDLMLEAGDVLKTWALPRPPRPDDAMECDALGDHRLAYLDYEGPLSNDRGAVTRWDHGHYAVERQSDAEWVVLFHGEKLAGRATLQWTAENSGRWRASFTTA